MKQNIYHPTLKIKVASTVLLLMVVMGFGFTKVGTTAAPFLKIECGARAVAMGGSFVALANDALGVYYNPAGFAELRTVNVSGGHVVISSDSQFGP